MAPRRRAVIGAAMAVVVLGSACASGPAASARKPRLPAPSATVTTTTTVPSAVPTTVPTPVVPAVGWSTPVSTLPPVGGYTGLSCISDVFCLAAGGGTNEADDADSNGPGVVAAWDGAVWATPSDYFESGSGADPPPWLPSLSCTDGPLCAVADGSGHAALGNGTAWSPPVSLATPSGPSANPDDPGPGHEGWRSAAVSCPTSRFCAYVDNTGHVATLSGTTWSPLQAFSTRIDGETVELYQLGRVGVSCPDSSDCTAFVGGTVLDWNGSRWSSSPAPWTGGSTSGATAVSCPVVGTCVAVHGGYASTRSGGAPWSTPRLVDDDGHLDAVSCPATATCVAADAYGDVVRMTDGTWSDPDKVVTTPTGYSGDGTSLSCPTVQYCMILTGDGDYAQYQGPDAGTPTTTATTAVP